MANAQGIIDEVIGSGPPQEVSDLTQQLITLRTEYRATVKDINAGMESMRKATGVSSVSKGVEEVNEQLKKLPDLNSQIERTQARLNQALSDGGKALAEEKLKLQEAMAANKDYAKGKMIASGSIGEMKRNLKELEKAIDLVVDAEGKGAAQVKNLIGEYNKLDTVIRKYEQSMGNYRRSVGHYASAFNGMNLAVGQLVRELPNAGISLQTFIVSISNNIGGLQDAITGLRAQNVALAAEGKATTSVLGAIGRSFFSWPTLVMGVVTVLTAYSKEISNFFKGTTEATEATNKFKESLASVSDQAAASYAKESTHLALLVATARDDHRQRKDRIEAVLEMQKLYPFYFENLDKERIMYGDITEELTLLYNALQAKAGMNATEGVMEASLTRQYEIRKRERDIAIELSKLDVYGFSGYMDDFKRKRLQKEQEALKKEFDQITSDMAYYQAEFARYAQAASSVTKTPLSDADKAKSDKEAAKLRAKRRKEMEAEAAELAELHKRIMKYLRLDILDDRNYALEDAEGWIKYYKEVKKRVQDAIDTMFDKKGFGENDPYVSEEMDRLTAATLSTPDAARLTNEINSRKTPKQRQEEVEKQAELLKKTVQSIQTILQAVSQAISAITAALAEEVNRNADREIENITRVEQAELESLDRRTMGVKQREEEKKRIEAEAEARRQKIEKERIKDLRKFAAFQKGIDINLIIANTALAVTSALSEKGIPYYLKVINAISAGVAGAAQLATVIAQPLPQYATGRKGGPEEFAIVSERGQESKTDKHGRFSLLPRSKSAVHLDEGDTVHTAEETKKRLQNAAFVRLAGKGGTVTEDSYGAALLEAYVDGTNRIESAIKKSKSQTHIHADRGWAIRYSQIIRG